LSRNFPQDAAGGGNYLVVMALKDLTNRPIEPACNRIDWAAALVTHGRWLRTVVLARLGEPAAVEDVLQDVRLAAIANGHRLRDPDKVAPWLYRIAVASALEHRRRCGRRRKLALGYAAQFSPIEDGSREPDPLSWLLADERRVMVRQALGGLPRREAEILLLKYTEDWSYQQIADLLGITTSAVEARLHRARQRLRRGLSALDPSRDATLSAT
jgi:RNA polymerase sigma-70 factor (ECF subfamily)